MLGMARSQIIQRRLRGFVAPTSRPVVDAFLETMFASPGKRACEALLLTATGAAFWADLQASSEALPKGERNWCRLAVSDIAALKRGEEAQQRVEALAAAIAGHHRSLVETDLLGDRMKRKTMVEIHEALRDAILEPILKGMTESGEMEEIAERLLRKETDPYSIAEEVARRCLK